MGKSLRFSRNDVKPCAQKYSAFPKTQIRRIDSPVSPDEGRFANVTNARWDAMDATASGAQGIAGRIELRERLSGVRTNGAANCLRRNSLGWVRGPARALARRARTAKSCCPGAPMLASSLVEMCPPNRVRDTSAIRKATVAKVQGSPRRARISRNPSCGESRMIRLPCGLLVRFVRTTAGAIGARLSLRPFPGEGEADAKPRAPRAAGTYMYV
jgi:hypothetical protein